MSHDTQQTPPTQEALRDYAWKWGTCYPGARDTNLIALATQQPHQGYVYWQITAASIEALKASLGERFMGAAHVVRVYDVTELSFDGTNAHGFFDLDVSGLSGSRFFHTALVARMLLAEVGFRLGDGSFHALARSTSVFFSRPGSSGNYAMHGLYVGQRGERFPVDNVFDAPVFARYASMLRALHRSAPPSVSVLHATPERESYLKSLTAQWERMGAQVAFSSVSPARRIGEKNVSAETALKPSDILFSYGLDASSAVARELGDQTVRWVASLPSVAQVPESVAAGDLERILKKAARIVVPDLASQAAWVEKAGIADSQFFVIEEVLEEKRPDLPDPGSIKQNIGLHPCQPMVLFAAEISHAAGADLLMEAICQVSGATDLQFCFVGEGPIKGELEGHAWGSGLAHRVKFLGDVPHEWFMQLLAASEFVVAPARTWQDPAVAELAVQAGRPVLTTHQAHLPVIQHGQNGLVTYDNPGSIVWGLKEMQANPLQGNMLRVVARNHAQQGKTLAACAIEHLLCFMRVLGPERKEAQHG